MEQTEGLRNLRYMVNYTIRDRLMLYDKLETKSLILGPIKTESVVHKFLLQTSNMLLVPKFGPKWQKRQK